MPRTIGIHNIVGVTMLLFLSNKISQKIVPSFRLWAHAFSATNTGAFTGPQTKASRINNNNNNNGLVSPFDSQRHGKCFTTTTNLFDSSGTVEQDLNSALDELLAGTFDDDDVEVEDVVDDHHIQDSKPIQSTLIEEDKPTDFSDKKFLSTSNPRWTKLGLDQRVIDVLSGMGITHFTPVQGEAFEPVLAGRDVIGRSRTGTGKTLAFGLPAITRLVDFLEKKGVREPQTGRMQRGRGVSMLVLCPTRELARQVSIELSAVARPLGLHADVFHGGVSYDGQTRALRNGLDILVGTPGRIIDHLNRGNLRLNEADLIVLDEADEMLSMGFADDVETILDGLGVDNGKKPQCLLFSATTPPWVKQIGRKYQEKVVAIDATNDTGGSRVATTVRHTAIQVPFGVEAKKSILEDVIAIEISRDMKSVAELVAIEDASDSDSDDDDDEQLEEGKQDCRKDDMLPEDSSNTIKFDDIGNDNNNEDGDGDLTTEESCDDKQDCITIENSNEKQTEDFTTTAMTREKGKIDEKFHKVLTLLEGDKTAERTLPEEKEEKEEQKDEAVGVKERDNYTKNDKIVATGDKINTTEQKLAPDGNTCTSYNKNLDGTIDKDKKIDSPEEPLETSKSSEDETIIVSENAKSLKEGETNSTVPSASPLSDGSTIPEGEDKKCDANLTEELKKDEKQQTESDVEKK
mmetsp:Transcript_24524/g.28396  ORF Transcript_24524/g.28396 Transcript_24524/m.28396 type:complete len:689 (+) Transcript_24524:269-2335(+)